MPEGSQSEKPGQFDLVCTFEVKQNGTLCMTMLGDTPMPGYNGKGADMEKENKTSYKGMAQGVVDGMGKAGFGQGGGDGGGY